MRREGKDTKVRTNPQPLRIQPNLRVLRVVTEGVYEDLTDVVLDVFQTSVFDCRAEQVVSRMEANIEDRGTETNGCPASI
jgi:hypothetical protein